MQQIFDAKTTPKEYHHQGKNFPFPKLNSCPCCKMPISPKKNGFYERNAMDGEFSEKILIGYEFAFSIAIITQYITTRQTLIFPKTVPLPDLYER